MPFLDHLTTAWANREFRKTYRAVIGGLLAGGVDPNDAPAMARTVTKHAMLEQAAELKPRAEEPQA